VEFTLVLGCPGNGGKFIRQVLHFKWRKHANKDVYATVSLVRMMRPACRQRARRGPKSAASAETKEPGGGNRTWIRLSHGCEENTGRAIPKLGEAGLLDPARSGCCWPIFAYRVFRSLSVGSGQSKVLSGVAGYDLGFAERYPFPSMMKVSARSISLSAIT
jgi:hypothetical protein